MKIIASVLCVGMFLLSGCAGLKIERGATADNVFYSTGLPKLKVQVDKSFEYLGDTNRPTGVTYSNAPAGFGSRKSKIETHVFFNKEKSRVISIDISRAPTDGGWVVPKAHDWGAVKTDRELPTPKFVIQRGHELPDFLLVGSLSFNADNGMTSVSIRYVEPISPSQYSDLVKKKYEELNDASKVYIDDFMKRADSTYTLLEGKS